MNLIQIDRSSISANDPVFLHHTDFPKKLPFPTERKLFYACCFLRFNFTIVENSFCFVTFG